MYKQTLWKKASEYKEKKIGMCSVWKCCWSGENKHILIKKKKVEWILVESLQKWTQIIHKMLKNNQFDVMTSMYFIEGTLTKVSMLTS